MTLIALIPPAYWTDALSETGWLSGNYKVEFRCQIPGLNNNSQTSWVSSLCKAQASGPSNKTLNWNIITIVECALNKMSQSQRQSTRRAWPYKAGLSEALLITTRGRTKKMKKPWSCTPLEEGRVLQPEERRMQTPWGGCVKHVERNQVSWWAVSRKVQGSGGVGWMVQDESRGTVRGRAEGLRGLGWNSRWKMKPLKEEHKIQ